MRAAIILFPGINREGDVARALRQATGAEPAIVWHAEHELPPGLDLVVLPGGFSYGDYLRCGARADHAGGWRARGARRTGARHMQRVPDPVRGGPFARRFDAQRATALRLQDATCAGRECASPVYAPLRAGTGRQIRRRA